MNVNEYIPPSVEMRLKSGYTLGAWLPPGWGTPVYAIREYVLDCYLAVVDFVRWGDSNRMITPDKVMQFTNAEEWGYLSRLDAGRFRCGLAFETLAVWTRFAPNETTEAARKRTLSKLARVLSNYGFAPDLFALYDNGTAVPLPPSVGETLDPDCFAVRVITSISHLN